VTIDAYAWNAVGEFKNRVEDLRALEAWWSSASREPYNMYGRRRVGKSWLFRKFAHGKRAIILVAKQESTPARTFDSFAVTLEPFLGVRPQIRDIGELFQVLYRLGEADKLLVVIDEFPYLLGTTGPAKRRAATSVQAVIEEHRDNSKIKLILTGSLIAEMERLQEPKSPLYGRLRPLDVRPLPFPDARALMDSTDAVDQLTRFAIAGGMPRYLSDFGTGRLEDSVVTHVLDRRGGLFNEPLALLQNEVRTPATYFAILEALAHHPQSLTQIAEHVGGTTRDLTPYLETLAAMQMVAKRAPVGADRTSRNHQWSCIDNFIRFWFRFVRPFQSEIEAGADGRAYYRADVAPLLADHAATVFEAEVVRWIRLEYAGRVLTVGGWWGNALNTERRAGTRQIEEIDAVGLHRDHVVVVAEAKWTTSKLDAKVVTDLITYKVPALDQTKLNTSQTEIVLASRSGFTQAVHAMAVDDERIRLVTAEEILGSPQLRSA
jgi:AAA+ ATPase superfamily predicted ATPase